MSKRTGKESLIIVYKDISKLVDKNRKEALLVPTFIAGFWQVVELIRIDFPYIRFFSSTQLLADSILCMIFIGLLLLVVVLTIIAFDYIENWKSRYDYEGWKRHLLEIISNIVAWYIIILLGSLIVFFTIFKIEDENMIQGIIFILTIAPLFFVPLVYYSNLLIEKLIRGREEKKDDKDETKKNKKGSLYTSFFIVGIMTLIMLFSIFHQYLNFPNNLANTAQINSLTHRIYPKNKKISFLYHNDKYIFVRVVTSASREVIQMFEKKDLFRRDHHKDFKK